MLSLRRLPRSFFARPAAEVAPDLLGRLVVREVEGERLIARLVETEAYLGAPDRASHAWNGRRTARNESLYGVPGTCYVYLIYGLHHCMNVVTGSSGAGGSASLPEGGAVLLRAAEVVRGEETMRGLRGLSRERRPGDLNGGDLAGGPGKLCQALAVDRDFDGGSFLTSSLRLAVGEPVPAELVARGPRIGVGYAGEAAAWPLRFAVRGHRDVSRPRLI